MQLGAAITADTSDYDDANAAGDTGDDGITFPTFYDGNIFYDIPASNISAQGTGNLYAWIDFDNNGSFDTDEFASVLVSAGTAAGPLSWSKQFDAAASGPLFARFRFTSDTLTSADFATAASDGEVEDYQINTVPFTYTATCSATGSGDQYLDHTLYYRPGSTGLVRMNHLAILGAPDVTSTLQQDRWTTLGTTGGELIVAFTDNIMSNTGDASADFTIREIGAPESASVHLFPYAETAVILQEAGILAAADGSYFVGNAVANAAIDIDSVFGNLFAAGRLQFGAIKLISTTGSGDGPDMDALSVTVSQTCSQVRQPSDYSDAPIATYGEANHIVGGSSLYLGMTAPDSEASARMGGDNGVNADGDNTDGSNDEDGITLPTFTQGQSATITANVNGAGGYLQGWIDFGGNGTFVPVATNLQDSDGDGEISFSVNVPANAVTTQTYARFRWSTESGLAATSSASDGEVEDYALTIEPDKDYSDAPITSTSYGDASHAIDPSMQLGAAITADTSDYDDANAAGDTGDDGVVVPTLVAGNVTPVTISPSNLTGSGTGTLHGWIDFDGDGIFEAAEHASVGFNNGATGELTFFGYGTTQAAGTTFARFRLTSDTLTDADFATAASDGEVEDYQITVQSQPSLVCGVPENTGVGASIVPFDMNGLAVSSGAPNQSTIVTLSDGRQVTVSSEYVAGPGWGNFTMSNVRPVGKFLPQMNGVRGLRTGNGARMKLTFSPATNIIVGDAETLSSGEALTVTTNGGVWEQVDGTTPDDDLFISGLETQTMSQIGLDTRTDNDFIVAVSRNTSQLDVAVDAVGGLTGFFIAFVGSDNGDALISHGPAPHTVNKFTSCTAYGSSNLFIGPDAPDAENPADTFSADGTGDDTNNSGSADDEGGVTVPTTILATQTSDVTIPQADITGSGIGTLHAWIDFDGNGVFDVDEYASVGFNNGATGNLTFSGYGTAMMDGTTFARFRVTTDTLTSADAKKPVFDGEVEDYQITVSPAADLSITKTNTPGVNGEVDQADDTVTTGQFTTFTLVVTNNGPSAVTGALVTDNPSSGLTCTGTDAVTITGDGVPSGSFTIADLTGAGIALDTLTDGQSTILTYSCEVN